MTTHAFVELTELQSAVLMVAAHWPMAEIATYLLIDQAKVRLVMAAVCERMHVGRADQAVRLADQLGMLKQAGVVA